MKIYRSLKINDILWKAKILLGKTGSIPNFIIIGAQRCGTTSLFESLMEAQFILKPVRKEIHFFDINYMKGYEWYLSQFPYIKDENYLTGEATPYYFYHPVVPLRVYDFCKIMSKEIKFILLLRNPVDRAISHYKFNLTRGIESLSFEEAIKVEPQRIGGEDSKLINNHHYYSFNHQHFSYLSRGIYIEQLKRWLNFFPLEKFLIISSEEFFKEPQKIINLICKFFDREPYELRNIQKFNKSHINLSVSNLMRGKLVKYFEPYNKQLFELIGRSFDWD